MSKTHYILVLCTCPDEDIATSIAENLVAQHLAACVNILPGIKSIYQWQGNVESARESLLLIKTQQQKYDALQNTITNMHPYEVPEVIAININTGLPRYLQWLDTSLS